MKKKYKTPTMKVVEVQQTHMLCGSLDGSVKCFRGESVSGSSEEDGYGEAW